MGPYKGKPKKKPVKKSFFKGDKTLGARQDYRSDYNRKPQRQDNSQSRTQANYFAAQDWSVGIVPDATEAYQTSDAKNSTPLLGRDAK